MAIETITVVATGAPVPYERDPQRLIKEEPVTVERTTYYMRRLADGELRIVEASAKAPAAGKVK